MKKRMYYFTACQTLLWGIIIFGIDVALIALFISNILPLWVSTLPVALAFFATWYLCYDGLFSPICVSETTIKYNGKEYFWNDINVTAYPEGQRSIHYAYELYIGFQIGYTKETIKKHAICRVYLNEKNLDVILSHYKKRIMIVDSNGFCQARTMRTTKKIKNKIDEHNRKISREGSNVN